MTPFWRPEARPARSSKLRQEIFALGGRHRGDPLAGAIRELQEDNLASDRRRLLRAVIADLSQDADAVASVAPKTLSPGALAYGAVIAVALLLAGTKLWTSLQ